MRKRLEDTWISMAWVAAEHSRVPAERKRACDETADAPTGHRTPAMSAGGRSGPQRDRDRSRCRQRPFRRPLQAASALPAAWPEAQAHWKL